MYEWIIGLYCLHTRFNVLKKWIIKIRKILTSLLCLDIKSSSWLTKKEGGRALTPPLGMVISSLQIGHRNDPVSRVCEAAILVRQCRQTVCEHCSSFGVCSFPSYMPAKNEKHLSVASDVTRRGNCVMSKWKTKLLVSSMFSSSLLVLDHKYG